MHFEDIWNEAELLSSKLEDRTLDDIVKILHSRVDNLVSCANLPKDQALNIGEILFELATVANITERRNNTSVNVAAGLKKATETRKEEYLDPEIADEHTDITSSSKTNSSTSGS